jgi:hypothetical protein
MSTIHELYKVSDDIKWPVYSCLICGLKVQLNLDRQPGEKHFKHFLDDDGRISGDLTVSHVINELSMPEKGGSIEMTGGLNIDGENVSFRLFAD